MKRQEQRECVLRYHAVTHGMLTRCHALLVRSSSSLDSQF